MNATKTGATTNLIGIFVLALAVFGIDLDEESQKILVGAAGVIGLIINQVLIAWAQRQAPAKPDNKLIPDTVPTPTPTNNQNGFARIDCLRLVLILCAAMAACATTTLTPGKSIGAVSVVIERLALQIDQAQKAGQITNAREDELLDQLKAINGDLRLAYTLTGPTQLQSLEQIDARLTALRAELAKENAQ